jgi:hypothetical protein
VTMHEFMISMRVQSVHGNAFVDDCNDKAQANEMIKSARERVWR